MSSPKGVHPESVFSEEEEETLRELQDRSEAIQTVLSYVDSVIDEAKRDLLLETGITDPRQSVHLQPGDIKQLAVNKLNEKFTQFVGTLKATEAKEMVSEYLYRIVDFKEKERRQSREVMRLEQSLQDQRAELEMVLGQLNFLTEEHDRVKRDLTETSRGNKRVVDDQLHEASPQKPQQERGPAAMQCMGTQTMAPQPEPDEATTQRLEQLDKDNLYYVTTNKQLRHKLRDVIAENAQLRNDTEDMRKRVEALEDMSVQHAQLQTAHANVLRLLQEKENMREQKVRMGRLQPLTPEQVAERQRLARQPVLTPVELAVVTPAEPRQVASSTVARPARVTGPPTVTAAEVLASENEEVPIRLVDLMSPVQPSKSDVPHPAHGAVASPPVCLSLPSTLAGLSATPLASQFPAFPKSVSSSVLVGTDQLVATAPVEQEGTAAQREDLTSHHSATFESLLTDGEQSATATTRLSTTGTYMNISRRKPADSHSGLHPVAHEKAPLPPSENTTVNNISLATRLSDSAEWPSALVDHMSTSSANNASVLSEVPRSEPPVPHQQPSSGLPEHRADRETQKMDDLALARLVSPQQQQLRLELERLRQVKQQLHQQRVRSEIELPVDEPLSRADDTNERWWSTLPATGRTGALSTGRTVATAHATRGSSSSQLWDREDTHALRSSSSYDVQTSLLVHRSVGHGGSHVMSDDDSDCMLSDGDV
eukprot:TRINITY_DN9697_c0_g1_i5.p1 TRINITY_DN9697_c0_g1~~TRINITY_DN9697_c0_g1_i5.p1  ORF type:complete len:711 (+),score=136.25 TRINITY_DN9697_c0_g1_i5:2855-4987(+)